MALVVQRALGRSAKILGAGRAPSAADKATLATIVEPLCARLHEHGWYGDAVVAPLPALLASVLRVVQRVGNDTEHDALREAAYNVLAAAMRQRSALMATAHQGVLLEQFSSRDVELLHALVVQLPRVCVTTCELRFETVRNHKVLPRRLRLVNDPHGHAPLGPHWSLLDTSATTLQILGLATWTNTVIVPSEDPRFATAWRQLRLGTVSFVDGLQRWLAGQHMAPIRHEDRQQQAVQAIGAIEVSFRAFELTEAGFRMVRAMRASGRHSAASVHRVRQPLNEGSFQHLHPVR